MDPNVIKINVPMFIRLLELAREEIKQDIDLHKIAEACIAISNQHIISTADYLNILKYIQPIK